MASTAGNNPASGKAGTAAAEDAGKAPDAAAIGRNDPVRDSHLHDGDGGGGGGGDAGHRFQEDPPPGEAALLVSEFPPPPPFYKKMRTDQILFKQPPPRIPRKALRRGTARARAAADRLRAEAEAERLRQLAFINDGKKKLSSGGGLGDSGDGKGDAPGGPESTKEVDDRTGAILGGAAVSSTLGAPSAAAAATTRLLAPDDDETDPVVAVFGEIVEDPLLVRPLDRCDDPKAVRDRVKQLNGQVLEGFVRLVQDLVHRPAENKYVQNKN
jgi:hypothetical protein